MELIDNLLNSYGGKTLNKKILKDIIDDIKNYKPDKDVRPFIITDEIIIDEIKNFKNIKTKKNLSSYTIKNYLKMFSDLNKSIPNFMKELIDNKDDNKKINEIFNKIKNQTWLDKNYKDIKISRSLPYFTFITTLMNNIPEFKNNLNNYVINRIGQIKKELIVLNNEDQEDKVNLDKLKIKWDEYIKIVKDLTKNEKVNNIDKIIYNLYMNFPLRDDFGFVEITDQVLSNDINKNFYNYKNKKLYIRDYKNKKIHGNKIYDMPEYLHKLIMIEKDNNKKYIISKKNGTLYSNGKLSDYIRKNSIKYFKKSISIDDIRHSVVSYFDTNKSTKNKKELAKIMNHSIGTAMNVYNREEE